ncbi:cell wall integrity and stress response component 4 isoform X1 [Drosophila serrata]|uniref:cell wall integrity and stress response component 4 isoform X1 n=1 Tax=Drosophila serrata TaxID=7274 RepID=UPI000A1D0529|nr:cell wall integrity and stress response component 4 isoform X1 [Drosophila serrata]
MLRTISILALLVFSIATMADAKPIFIKVFAPNSGYSTGSTPTVSPINTQLISSLISTKIQLLNSVLQAKSSGGGFGFGFSKFVAFSSTTSTTERPVTHSTTEVNTDYYPDESSTSSTQTIYSTTIESAVETPKPTVHPEPPFLTSTTPVIPVESTTGIPEIPSTTRATAGYTYQTPLSSTATNSLNSFYLPASLASA